MKSKKAAILGGTFDPIHLGHLSIAKQTADELCLDTVYLMPAHVSPFKLDKLKTSDEDRLNMVRLAAKEDPVLSVLDLEIRRKEISYTWETLEELSGREPGTDLWFIVGGDSFLQLDKWNYGDKILQKYGIAYTIRPGTPESDCRRKQAYYEHHFGARIAALHNDPLDISSTVIRERAAEGLSLKNLVPQEVEAYIYDHGLYRQR